MSYHKKAPSLATNPSTSADTNTSVEQYKWKIQRVLVCCVANTRSNTSQQDTKMQYKNNCRAFGGMATPCSCPLWRHFWLQLHSINTQGISYWWQAHSNPLSGKLHSSEQYPNNFKLIPLRHKHSMNLSFNIIENNLNFEGHLERNDPFWVEC